MSETPAHAANTAHAAESVNTATASEVRPRMSGVGRVLVAVYAVLALAATGRSFYQIATKFDEAPVAYALSALAAVVYIVATIALVRQGRVWYRVAWATLVFEFTGVLVVGVLSILDPQLFPHDTVWSWFGRGYLFIPLVLPVLGMWWLAKHRPHTSAATSDDLTRTDVA